MWKEYDNKLAKHSCGARYFWHRFRDGEACRCCDGKQLTFADAAVENPEDQEQWEQYKNQSNSGDEVLGSNPASA